MEIVVNSDGQEQVMNDEGEVVVLNARESKLAAYNQKVCNDLGYEIPITTLTTVLKAVSEQKFFEIPPADFVPLVVGEGAWSSFLTTYRSYAVADDFNTGFLNTGSDNTRLAAADAGVDALNLKVYDWAKSIGWSIIDLEKAAKSGNWDLISAKEESRKKNWDLGIQKIAFLGSAGDASMLGLFTQVGVTNNTTVIQEPISGMTTTELKAFTQVIIETYRANCARTAWPTHFVIPESDYNGLVSQASPDFPIKSTLELLEEALKLATRNPGFKVLPCAYGDTAYNSLGKQMYALYNYDEKSLRMNLPVDYTNTLANSINNFQFQNVAYGEVTGVLAIRPLELLYFSY